MAPKPQALPEKLVRRDRSIFAPKSNSWSDLRAWICSCFLHTMVLVVIGLLWTPQTRGTLGEKDRPTGIAVVHETDQGNEYYLSGASGSATSSAQSAPTSQPTASDAGGPPVSLEQLLSDLTDGVNPLSVNSSMSGSDGTGLSNNGNTSGDGQGVRGNGPKAKTSFFGVEGTGSSFVYVVDRSDSMNVYQSGPLRTAKREVLKSLNSLNEYHQFQIVFYNESVLPMAINNGSGKMATASDTAKQRASSFVRQVQGAGATDHLPALKLGLSLAPDVLFFLTDAEDPSPSMQQLQDIQQRAERSLTTIHAIQFNVGPAKGDGGWIRGLAEMNRGTYKYVDVSNLENEE